MKDRGQRSRHSYETVQAVRTGKQIRRRRSKAKRLAGGGTGCRNRNAQRAQTPRIRLRIRLGCFQTRGFDRSSDLTYMNQIWAHVWGHREGIRSKTVVQTFRTDTSSEQEEKDITVFRNISCAKIFNLCLLAPRISTAPGQNLVSNAQQQTWWSPWPSCQWMSDDVGSRVSNCSNTIWIGRWSARTSQVCGGQRTGSSLSSVQKISLYSYCPQYLSAQLTGQRLCCVKAVMMGGATTASASFCVCVDKERRHQTLAQPQTPEKQSS